MLPQPVVVAGFIAGLFMALIGMFFEAAAGGGFWAPVTFLSAVFLRPLQSTATPVSFQLDPVLLGIFMQVVASITLSYLFALYVPPRVPHAVLPVAGAAYGAIIFAVVSSLLLPIVNPAIFRLNAGAFAIAHLCWGVILGAMIERAYADARLRAARH